MILVTVALTAALMMPGTIPGNVTQPLLVGVNNYNDSSFYLGEWYVEQHEHIRRCITWHESRDAYDANTGTGKFRGAYQFSRDLAVGAAWMIQKDLRKTVKKNFAIKMGEYLRTTPINHWHPYFQDYAFWIVWNKGSGKKHWDAVKEWCF